MAEGWCNVGVLREMKILLKLVQYCDCGPDGAASRRAGGHPAVLGTVVAVATTAGLYKGQTEDDCPQSLLIRHPNQTYYDNRQSIIQGQVVLHVFVQSPRIHS